MKNKASSDESTVVKKKTHKLIRFNDLMDNNKFVFLLALIIAFFVWVVVAMYASPEESYTIYNIPITIDTQNSIVSQKGYENFWQSDKTVDVTVKGPRYMITSLTSSDITVNASLNTVDTAGISNLALKVSLKDSSQDISISSVSKTAIQVYFDAKLEKEFTIAVDEKAIPDHIADGYEFKGTELPVSSVKLSGPETEVNKIVSVVADPQYTEDLLYTTSTIPVKLNFEGATAADTVSVNKYVTTAETQEYYVKINIASLKTLTTTVDITGTKTGTAKTTIDIESVNVLVDTAFEFTDKSLTIMTVDYSALAEGTNTYTVKLSDIKLPEGVTVTDDITQFTVTITYAKS